MAKIDIDKMSLAVQEVLDTYREDVMSAMENAVKKTAKETVKLLKQTSPEDDGDYKKSWNYKRDKNLSGKYRYDMVVYAKKYEYAKTHLLENGHAKRNGGRVEGIPHIKPAEDFAFEMLGEELRKQL